MADKPDDRPQAKNKEQNDAEPKIYVIVDGQKFPRPGLRTFFAAAGEDQPGPDREGCSCQPVVGVWCRCLKVSEPAPGCSCVGHTGGKSQGGYGCRCAPVH